MSLRSSAKNATAVLHAPGDILIPPGRPEIIHSGGDYWEGVCGGTAAAAAAASPLTKSLSSLLGLKKGMRLGGTSTLAPVFGLRPTRPRRWRVRKLPKPRISILSPVCSAWMMESKMVSTIASDSLRGNSVARMTSSTRSALVMVVSFITFNSPNNPKVRGRYLRLLQGALARNAYRVSRLARIASPFVAVGEDFEDL